MDRILTLSAGAGLLAAILFSGMPGNPAPRGDAEDLLEQGRQVYIAEGCIHCHSQYVRPVGGDTGFWGPETRPEQALAQKPVLIGNRRQGPDLANVGMRRPADWNRMHLMDPRSVSPASRMPSYAHLFAEGDSRGEALLAYLGQLKPETGKDLVEQSGP